MKSHESFMDSIIKRAEELKERYADKPNSGLIARFDMKMVSMEMPSTAESNKYRRLAYGNVTIG